MKAMELQTNHLEIAAKCWARNEAHGVKGVVIATPYFFGGKAASNGPNKVATCSVEGCTNPSRWQSKCDFHLTQGEEEK